MITKNTYKKPPIDFNKVNKSMTLPSQALTMKEIMERFTRGVPIDAKHRNPVYLPENDIDLEKVSRMDFAEKHAFQQELSAQNERVRQAFIDKAEQAKADAAAAQEATHRIEDNDEGGGRKKSVAHSRKASRKPSDDEADD